MQKNESELNGVLQHDKGKNNYDLRRYFPSAELSDFIEQFWFVDWQQGETTHTQQNLPDPNFHLIFYNDEVKLIAPVTKIYSFEMQGKSGIVGIKFKLGALCDLLQEPMSEYVDKQFSAEQVFQPPLVKALDDVKRLIASQITKGQHPQDERIMAQLQQLLLPYVHTATTQLDEINRCLQLIKHNTEINTVEQLSELSGLTVRTVQRYFQKYVGISPKWLIRKYRLHQALSDLEDNSVDILDVVIRLGYVDQSHLIRDFRQIIGITPKQYRRS